MFSWFPFMKHEATWHISFPIKWDANPLKGSPSLPHVPLPLLLDILPLHMYTLCWQRHGKSKPGWGSGQSACLKPLSQGLVCIGFFVITPRVFLQVLQFPSLDKKQCSKFQLDLETEVNKSYLAFSLGSSIFAKIQEFTLSFASRELQH